MDSDSEEEDLEPETNFETIIGEMVGTGYAEGHPTEAISLEIKSFKFAQNKVWNIAIPALTRGSLGIL